jgi:chemotaxis protein methyltransferase CheR
MTVTLDARAVERFRAFVTRRFGLHLDDTKLGGIADLLRRRLDANGQSCAAFLDALETEHASPELRALAAELTVPETYFFRNIDQFRAFTEVVVPDRLRARGEAKQLRILSLGCATGDEPYSLAILLREAGLDPSWQVSIVGLDVNRAVLEKAQRGRFTRWALRETPADFERRWFRQEGAELVLDEEIRRSVTFEEHNLVEGTRDAWPAGTYDVVFWRNVMMYFAPQHAQAVVARVTRALAPGGYLFLGHAETLRGISNDFHLRHTHETFYYQRKLDSERRDLRAPEPSVDRALAASAPEPLAALFEGADSWVDTIHKASQRIRVLSDASQPSEDTTTTTATTEREGRGARSVTTKPAWNLALTLELLEEERFTDALELLGTLPPESSLDPQVLLLRAVLLTHSGQLARAEEVCHELLAVDELDAGAHYLLALCREGAGDRRAAADHDQVAVYLDPGFAMPRLHLGLLARRANDRESARRDLGQALVLLQREDASRLLLFGGGFGREALITLCRTELFACGGTP